MADADDVLADRMEAELGVEGRHAVDLRERDPVLLVDLEDPLPADVAVLLLRLLESGDQDPALALRSAGS